MAFPAATLAGLLIASQAVAATSRDWNGIFPCDPRALPVRPVVLMLADHHDGRDPSADSIGRMIAVRGAARGDFFSAVEVGIDGMRMTADKARELVIQLGLPAERARLYGLEGSPATAYAVLWLANSPELLPIWLRSPQTLERGVFQGDPDIRRAFEAALAHRRLPEPGTRALARALAFGEASPYSWKGGPEDVLRLKWVLQAAFEEAADIVRHEYDEPAARVLIERAAAANGDDKLGFLMELRDRDFAQKSASLYCLAGLERKNLAIVIGADHVPGVKAFLKQWTPAPLDITVLDVKRPEQAVRAQDILSSWHQ